MSVLKDYGLKDPDVDFLLGVQQIEQNPTEYDNTDVGETVANVTSIREATDLTRSQIDYRVTPGTGGRGFTEDGMGFIRTYEATIEGRNFGPRSVELTEKGERVVAEIKEIRSPAGGRQGGAGGGSSDRVEELEAQVSELEDKLETMSEQMATIQQSRMGALGGDMSAKLETISRAVPRHDFVLTEVFGVDVAEIKSVDMDDPEAIRKLRVSAYNHLTKSLDGVESEGDDPVVNESGGGVSPRE